MKNKEKEIKKELEVLRERINEGTISYREIAELEELAPYIEEGDTLLLEWANVPEFPVCKKCWNKVTREKVSEGYAFYCPNCDEDLYSFEVANEEDILTKVKFVVFKGEIVALFPEITNGEGLILSYAHIGQHSTAHRDLLKCKRATFAQYKDLANELENLVGYNLVII